MEFLAAIDFVAIFKIIMIDLLLGLDNAIVIALAVATLAPAIRGKAIFLGTAGAIILRGVLLLFATFLLGVPYLKLIAGLYLAVIGFKLLTGHEDDPEVEGKTTIWGAVTTILIADFMMSLDNVMGVAGAAQGTAHSAIYATIGVLVSIPVIVYGAKYLAKLMDKFTIIVWIGAGMLGVVGAEMVIADPLVAQFDINHLVAKIVGGGLVIVPAFIYNYITKSE